MHIVICLSSLILAVQRAPAESRRLLAGAAAVDITPAQNAELPMSGYAARTEGFKGIHDRLHVRAIVLSDGVTTGGIVVAELIGFSNQFWEKISKRMSEATGIPAQNIMLTAVHTHSAPSIGTYGEKAEGDVAHRQEAYLRQVEDALIDALKLARDGMQPAKCGFGSGSANVNINRRAQLNDGTWWLGYNPDGPSDKTVAVVKIESVQGAPIALLVNYAMHGTGMGQDNYQISADVAGATSTYVEEHFKNKVVVAWTSGAAGDQCPIYDRAPGSFEGVGSVGRLLGVEVIRIAETIRTSGNGSIRAVQQVISCPGRRVASGRTGSHVQSLEFADADPVPIRLSLLMVDKIALAGVSGEVFNVLAQELKAKTPQPKTIMMITHCNGSSGYLPDDGAYRQLSYEIQTTQVKPGCAQEAIVDGLFQMIRKKQVR
jgi:hypothetical protein